MIIKSRLSLLNLFLELSEREVAEKLLEEVKKEVLSCRKCELWKGKKNYVFGEGNPCADLMFIGEAPGHNEDLQGRPFVGAAGKLLTNLIEEVLGLKREDVYIANVLKCRPPGNRDPLPDEIKACTPYLDRQIAIIKPRIIATLGRHSTKYILSKVGIKVSSITAVRGKIFEGQMFGINLKILPTYHPAAALYNPRLKESLKSDFFVIKKILEEKYEKKGGNLLSFMR